MLIQKGLTPTRKRLLLIAGVIVLGGLGYVGYTSFFQGKQEPTNAERPEAFTETVRIPTFSPELFRDPKLLTLKPSPPVNFIEQAQGKSTDADAPNPPERVHVSNPGIGNTLYLWWENPTSGSYDTVRVYRSTNQGEPGQAIAELGKEMTFYKDTNVINDSSYFYTVRTVKGKDVESSNQDQYNGTPTDVIAPGTPTDIAVQDLGDGQNVQISWVNPPDIDFNHSRVYRSSLKGSIGILVYNTIGGKPGESKTIKDPIVKGISYYYTVTSVDANGNESSTDLSTPTGKLNPFQPIIF